MPPCLESVTCSRYNRRMQNAGSRISALDLHVFASGSKGNAALVVNHATGEGVLVDCGICKRDFFAYCGQVGFDPACLTDVLITHEHTDHTKGLGVVLRGLAKAGVRPRLHASMAVSSASAPVQEVIEQGLCDFAPFASGTSLSVAGIDAHVFATSHDAVESFGFRFERGEDAIGFMTDTGVVLSQAHEALSDVRVLAIESNHDEDMLRNGPYPYPLKRRVAGEKGHLSNAQAAAELTSLLCNRLETVVAMHVSQNNNSYELPGEVLERALRQAGHGAQVQVALQGSCVSVG